MSDLYLRADTEAALDAALELIEGAAIDRIGIITRLVDGELAALPGWHANVRLAGEPSPELLADLDGLLIAEPVSPFRVWL